MAENGSVIIKIKGDDSDFNKKLNHLGGTATNILKATAAVAAAAGTAVAALGTAAVKAYADYEQLVGGVETLFKDSADVVKQYADNAYKTAGISANTYMETVTSFSASLLQSLGGDTKAAADMSDMALRDMADNANKMGSNMDTIIQTYQSLSRGNYAMLDNLKLGYGGTKAEMERLIATAAELDSSVQANDMSFGNMVKAIHAVQTEMGITGTTAKEASTTIQGSITSMQASWKNLMVGMADETQDFDTLLANFIDSVGTVAENLLPRVEIVLGGVAKLIAGLIPEITAALPELVNEFLPNIVELGVDAVASLVEGLQQNSNSLAEGAVAIIGTLAEGVVELLPLLADTAATLMISLGEYLVSSVPNVLLRVPEIVISISDAINENATRLLMAAAELLLQLGIGMIQAIPDLIANIPTIIEAVVKAFFAFQWLNLGANLVVAISNGVKGASGGLVKAASDISAAFTGKIKELPQKMLQVGKDIVQGVINGIKNKVGAVAQAAREMAANVLSSMKEKLGIRSPSKKAEDEVGEMVGEGAAVGIEKSGKKVVQASDRLTKEISDSFSGGLEKRMAGAYEKMRVAMQDGMQKLTGDIAVQSKGNTSYTTNTTHTKEGDFVVHIDKVVNDGKGSVADVLQEADFIRRQKEMAKGGE